MKIEDKIRQIISDSLGIPEEQITKEAEFQKDLNIGPMELADLFMGFEKEFNIPISHQDSTNLITVGDIINFIEENSDEYREHI